MSLKLLAIDTTSEACSAALLYQQTIVERYEVAPRQQSQLILPMMQSLLDAAELQLSDLDALAFTRGPGSFTGIRIAASIIQASALVADLPVVLVSSLQCLAQGAHREFQTEQVFTAIDARMNEIFCANYRLGKDAIMHACETEKLINPERLQSISLTDFIGVGSGWDQYHSILTSKSKHQLRQWVPQRYPRAYDVAVIASWSYQRGEVVSAAEALPTYLREKVASRGLDG